MSIQLTPDQEAIVNSALKQGAHLSPEAFITKALENQRDEEEAILHWLRTEIVEGHAEYLRDPSSAVPAGKVLASIKALRKSSS